MTKTPQEAKANLDATRASWREGRATDLDLARAIADEIQARRAAEAARFGMTPEEYDAVCQ